MSKVIVYHAYAKDSYPVASSTVSTGWLPGQFFCLNSTGEYAQIASVDKAMFMAIDDDDELSSPPTGSIVTGIYGAGTKVLIDHSEEVAANSSARAYDSSVESATINQLLYCDANGKLTTTVTGSVKAQVWKIPSAANNYSLGVILRI